MDENILSFLEQQSQPFVSYLKQFPELEVQVIADVTAAFLVLGLLYRGAHPALEQVIAGRDRAFRLCGVADGAGLADLASFFYQSYEVLCGYIAWYHG